MSEKQNPADEIQTQEDVVRLANEGCLKMFNVNLAFLKAALDASGTPFTKEGLMVLAVMSKVIDLEKEKER